MVEDNLGDPVQVEYASDLDVRDIGSGFGIKGQKIIHEDQNKYLDHPWNLKNVHKQANSLMQFPRKEDIAGINIPWLYIGMKYSTFCWHYEDLMMFSMNYSHWGSPKMWYCIPESDREKFDRVVKQKISYIVEKDPNILLDVILMISPAYLKSQNLKVYKTL